MCSTACRKAHKKAVQIHEKHQDEVSLILYHIRSAEALQKLCRSVTLWCLLLPPPPKIEALESELDEVGHRAALYEEEMAEESQSQQDLQLMDSQVCCGVCVWCMYMCVLVCCCVCVCARVCVCVCACDSYM